MDDHVSVSGLDLSRDKQELLVSYESDQIYSFPVFPHGKSPSGMSLDQLKEMSDEAENGNVKVLDELAAYGGHLNRLTFLKVSNLEMPISFRYKKKRKYVLLSTSNSWIIIVSYTKIKMK